MKRSSLAVTSAFVSSLVVSLPVRAQVAQPPPAAPGTVTLPLAEYDRLVDRGARPPAPPAVAPVAAVVGRAELDLRASATDLRGTITLRGEVLRAGHQKVPLFIGGTLLDAEQAGSPVAVAVEGNLPSAILPGPGPFALVLGWATQAGSQLGRASALLPEIRSGSVRATIEAPGETTDVSVDPGIILSRSSSAGKTVVIASLVPGTLTAVTWSSRDRAGTSPREARFTANVRTLVTVGEADVRLATLFDLIAVDGQPDRFTVRMPEGFDVASVSGPTVEADGQQPGSLMLVVRDPASRRHQFLLTLERAAAGGVQHAEFALPAIDSALRETGEVAWEAQGTVDLATAEKGPLRRLDVTEVSTPLRSLSRSPLLSAFRYQRIGAEPVAVVFDARRFPDSAVAAALAERAVVTTLLTGEGRALTEVTLTLRNRGQLFLKVGLPKGAALVSAEVGNEPVKPVEGSDGARVPLVRPGFNPPGAYQVSFVYVSSGSPLGKKGDAEIDIARVDVPIGLVEWEVFLPDRYQVRRFTGDLIPRELLPPRSTAMGGGYGVGAGAGTGRAVAGGVEGGIAGGVVGGVVGGLPEAPPPPAPEDRAMLAALTPDQVAVRAVDSSGAVLPGVTVIVTQGAARWQGASDASGWFVVSRVPPGPVTVRGELTGFRPMASGAPAGAKRLVRLVGQVAGVAETVQVYAETPPSRETAYTAPTDTRIPAAERKAAEQQGNAPSQNVVNLQRRVSGVLPVRMDIPRAGRSYLFVRPLVLDEDTTLTFSYRRK